MSSTHKKGYKTFVEQLRSSNIEAFEKIFKDFHENIFNFLFFKIGDTQTAEDILQDVFIKLWENRHNLKSDLSLASYLYTIAKNLTANYFRHKKVVQNFQKELEFKIEQADYPSQISNLELHELNENFIAALEKLPEQQRTVFMMSRFDQLSYKEIAERLGISIKTVETHIGKALKTLRTSIKSL